MVLEKIATSSRSEELQALHSMLEYVALRMREVGTEQLAQSIEATIEEIGAEIRKSNRIS